MKLPVWISTVPLEPLKLLTLSITLDVGLSNTPVPRKTRVFVIDGDKVVGRGDNVRVEAFVQGIVPATGKLVVRNRSRREQQYTLEQDREIKEKFGRTLENVQDTFTYQIRLNDGVSPWFQVQTVPRPTVATITCEQEFPAYTNLKPLRRSLGDSIRGILVTGDSYIDVTPGTPRFPLLCKILDAQERLSVQVHPPANVAARLGGCRRLVVAGSGLDHVAARELALKIEEGARVPAVAHHLETVRHGHLATADGDTGLVLIVSDAAAATHAVLERARAVLRSAAVLGMPAAVIVGAETDALFEPELTPAGRIALPRIRRVAPVPGTVLSSALALQLLAERLARARGTNPDTIGRDDPRQMAAHD